MKRRITLDELTVGEPVPWDAYSQDGRLLLRHGQCLQTQSALNRLIEEGLFLEVDNTSYKTEAPVAEGKPSALQHILDAQRMLSHIFEQKPENIDDFAGRMDKLVHAVEGACDAHPGVALSSILLMVHKSYGIKHPIDVAILANLLANALSLDDATRRSTVAAALTMNIGMYEVQDKINEIAGPLSEKLMSMIRTHPARGAERLAKLGIGDEKWLAFVRQHHEHSDGSGYPDGIAGDAIQIGARIIGAADKYCAMVSARGYRAPQKPNVALRDLYVRQGQKIDTVVAGTMIRIVGLYPVGTLVRLKSSEIAVVTGPGESPDAPAAHAIVSRSGVGLEVASYRKTHLAAFAIEEVLTIDKINTPVRMTALWGKDAKLR